eukprot:TRINITY_DN38658_c0_g1_i1.p2 TRINITY_DN38658_c0_g1~~TRINITY_DN38658_c0_g1_i1.p2  ORF type:complete len:100 (-),score=7.30 TRINITY_DN38658_c0_g1_i1:32-331(-)
MRRLSQRPAGYRPHPLWPHLPLCRLCPIPHPMPHLLRGCDIEGPDLQIGGYIVTLNHLHIYLPSCLLYTSDAADEEDSVDLGGRRIIKKKKKEERDKSR